MRHRRTDSLHVVDPSTGIVVAHEVEIAATWRRRLVGWMLRNQVPEGTALWIPRTRAIHTIGLRTAIDVVFVDGAGTVLALRHLMRPYRAIIGPRGTAATVELAPGRAFRARLRTGQRLALLLHRCALDRSGSGD